MTFRAPELEAFIRGRCSCRQGSMKPQPGCVERLRRIKRLENELHAVKSSLRHWKRKAKALAARLESAEKSG